jgi:anti-anti-sigma regulatory factor
VPEAGAGNGSDRAQPGAHNSVSYTTDDECRDLLTGFVRRAVAAGHRVVVFLDTDAADLGRAVAAAAQDAAPGQFSLLCFGTTQAGAAFGAPADAARDATDGPGRFGVAEMLDGLDALYDQTLAEGYPGISVAGDMRWTLRAGLTPAELLSYETQVNRFFGEGRSTAVCLYDRRRFPAELLDRIAAVHPGPLLRFTLGGWGTQLRLTGELDASNADALPPILDLVSGADAVVLLDASDLRFVDVAGAGTIVRFAAARPTRHTVVRCARGVRQALQLAGAETVPSLMLRDRVAGV